ncbi:DUF4411 family protein (plasmid) [Exiguobacterium sp. Helios]|uniref:DUF4411 family protein n=1 Tax=Exiguobacterium sp. Helios TaxID=2735868 RepID=UPI00165DB0DB|nr:DUF4411 family protein [Exiguobacterium sp. Helios]QNR22484.1 DUF4411 family protein [Exiguobacterium sp. Helios]
MIKYFLDTNIIRDLSTRSKDTASRLRRMQCKSFWEKIMDDLNSLIYLSDEVQIELKVQLSAMHFKETEITSIRNAISDCIISTSTLSSQKETSLRLMSAYLKNEYGSKIRKETGFSCEYLQVSDARILYTAFEEDGVLVTRNIKDFLIYLLFFDHYETVLYDISQGAYINFSQSLYNEIQADSKISDFLSEIID